MNNLGVCKYGLSSKYQLMSGHQLTKLLRLARLTVMSAISSVTSNQRFDHARDWCHASIKSFAIEIVVRSFFRPTLVSLLDIYSESPSSIPLLYSVLLFRASSYVKAINHVQLNYTQVIQVHIRSSALVISPAPSLKSVLTPSVDSQVNTTVRDPPHAPSSAIQTSYHFTS
jgi:hypothetical protein